MAMVLAWEILVERFSGVATNDLDGSLAADGNGKQWFQLLKLD